ncbi:hypothetical protein ACWGPD_10000 [Streptomyces hirsutus]|uniref:hypothetical protein n=1 Tax=Streptomyces hirsutus TaxID=35620 RepID=UPI003630FF99
MSGQPVAGRSTAGYLTASVVLAVLQILAGGCRGEPQPGGIVPLGGAVAVGVLLTQRSAIHWFGRLRTPGTPSQPPYA